MDKEIISFKDFLSPKDQPKQIIEDSDFGYEVSKIEESGVFEIDDRRMNLLMNDFGLTPDEIGNLTMLGENSVDDFYTLYKDVNESFSCDIFIEGANPNKSTARLIIESEDWNLVFNGYIEDGKCIIPIKKLDILKENLIGEIKLEVIAEGNVFVPWQNKFLVKSSRKVSTMNEKLEKKIGVKVDGIK